MHPTTEIVLALLLCGAMGVIALLIQRAHRREAEIAALEAELQNGRRALGETEQRVARARAELAGLDAGRNGDGARSAGRGTAS